MPQWVNGLGQSLGDQLVTGKPLVTSYTTYFVSSATGDDTNNNGLDPNSPFATTAKAVSTASGASVTPIVVYLSGHTETFTVTVTPSAGSIFVGAGSSGGKPTVKLKMNASNTIMFTCSTNGIQLRNIWFQSNQQASNVARIKFTSDSGLVSGCYFECGGTDNAAAVELGATSKNSGVEGCTFISTATVVTSKPSYGLLVSSAVSDIDILNCTFSDGTLGFANSAFAATATITRMRVENTALLLGANASLGASTGIVLATTVTGSGSISYSGGA